MGFLNDNFEEVYFPDYVILKGEKTGRWRRTQVKVALCLALLTLTSAVYMVGDLASLGGLAVLRASSDDIEKTTYFTYINTTEDEETPEGYLVWNPSCRIPDVSPWHESIRSLVKHGTLPSCGARKSSVRRLPSSGHLLTVHDSGLDCCYSLIARKDLSANNTSQAPDDVYSVGKCVDFRHNVTFVKEEQYIKVICTKHGLFKSKTSGYIDMHAFVRETEPVKKKIAEIKQHESQKYSVMLFGIDSISRLNLFRTMPRTVEHLNQTGWLPFRGYNKIDDNTFPNLMAILSGYTTQQLRKTCWTHTLDACPIIWKDFSKHGYITAYAEDEPIIGTFNYHKSGFVKTPTDYYIRPFMLAAEKLPFKKKDSLKVCLGPTPAADHIIEYAIDFAKAFPSYPTFSLFWMNSFSHNDLNTPSAMDGRILKFFKDLEKTGAMNNTIVIFLSDHGMRFGKIRETYIGWIEERLPFIYFWIPPSFRTAFPEKYKSLKRNAGRLTSPFDVHLTLRELLGLEVNGTKGCQKCQSLLETVRWNRSCADAGISEHWCTCAEYKVLSAESLPVRNIASYVLDHLNGLVSEAEGLANGTRCATLSLHRVRSIRSRVFTKRFSGHEEYVILFETTPGNALFEATVGHHHTFQLKDTVSRVNAYGSQSKCMNDSFLQKYCYCQNAKGKT